MNLKYIATIFAIIFATSTFAFKISTENSTYSLGAAAALISGDPIHESITEEALKSLKLFFSDGTAANIKNDFIYYVKQENTENDINHLDQGWLHFDNSMLEESSEYVYKSITAAINGFKNGSYDLNQWTSYNNYSAVQSNIGSAMHTLQDFYAHSTWVETNSYVGAFLNNNRLNTNLATKIPMPKIGILKNPFTEDLELLNSGVKPINDFISSADNDSIAGGCTDNGYDGSVYQITTAYYDYAMSPLPPSFQGEDYGSFSTNEWNKHNYSTITDSDPANGIRINWPLKRCIHGASGKKGINKDDPTMPFHPQARANAVDATRNLMLHFIRESGALDGDLKSKEKACALIFDCNKNDAGQSIVSPGLPYINNLTESTNESGIKLANRTIFQVTVGESLMDMLEVKFHGEKCDVINQETNASGILKFSCGSAHRGIGKITIAQIANPNLFLLETDFVLNAMPGLNVGNQSTGITSLIVDLGARVNLWLDNALNYVKFVTYKIGDWTYTVNSSATDAVKIAFQTVTNIFSADGDVAVVATYTDSFGGVFQSIKTVKVILPTPTIIALLDDVFPVTGKIDNDGTSDDNRPSLVGTLPNALPIGYTIRVHDNGSLNAIEGALHINGADWDFTPTNPLSVGKHSLSAHVVNTTANSYGDESAPWKVTVLPQAAIAPSQSITFIDKAVAIASGWTVDPNVSFISGRNGGKAAKFGGVGSSGAIKIPNNANMQFTDGATFDMWVRLDSMTGMNGYGDTVSNGAYAMALLAKSHDASGAAFMINSLTDPNSSAWVASYDASFYGVAATCKYVTHTPIPIGTWVKTTYVLSPTTGVYVYLNGQLSYSCASARPSLTYMNTQDLYIGRFSSFWYPVNGAIQDIRIYKKALTAAEVAALP